MRLASLKEFRSMVYSPESAPTMATLRARISANRLPGGRRDGGRYYVDLDEFDRVTHLTDQIADKRRRLAESPLLEGLL